MRSRAIVATGCLALLCPGALHAADPAAFSASEIGRILAHGPWPQAAARDPSNRASGNPAAIALGERLFFSPRLSGTGGVLCASCHEPWRAFTDGRPRALGLELVDRNTPTLANVRLNRWFGWDGSNDNLWAQSIRPLLEPREMNSSAARIGALVRADPGLSGGFEKAFGAKPPADDAAVLAGVGKALSAYQETLASGRTPFDDLRDALAGGDADAVSRYPARRGLKIFLGKGRCEACHAGPGFTDGAFHRAGVASLRRNGKPDTGREDGIRTLLANPFNLLGPYNDDPLRATGTGTRKASSEANTAGAFRTPGLRNVALTAPYMHDGSVATLCDVARRHPGGEVPAADLSPAERSDLVAFLETLTESGSRSTTETVSSCS
jgi:cytochrome c peroxidase